RRNNVPASPPARDDNLHEFCFLKPVWCRVPQVRGINPYCHPERSEGPMDWNSRCISTSLCSATTQTYTAKLWDSTLESVAWRPREKRCPEARSRRPSAVRGALRLEAILSRRLAPHPYSDDAPVGEGRGGDQ